MDLVLLTITIGALGLAVGLGIIGWKLLRQDSTDAHARVEHLRALAAEPDGDPALDIVVAPAYEVVAPAHETAAIEAVPVFARLTTFGADEPELDWDATLGQGQPVESHGTRIFGAPATTPVPSRRLALVGAVAAVMLGSAGTAYAVYRPQPAASAGSSAEARVPADTVPLDLLSLNEATDADGTFTVTGLVGNPANGRAASQVMAVVYLFDREGHYFATGRAGIDVAALTPGDESPFVVKVAHGSGAARYRVGFRHLDGTVVAHVDKRAQALDGTTETAGSTSPAGSPGPTSKGAGH